MSPICSTFPSAPWRLTRPARTRFTGLSAKWPLSRVLVIKLGISRGRGTGQSSSAWGYDPLTGGGAYTSESEQVPRVFQKSGKGQYWVVSMELVSWNDNLDIFLNFPFRLMSVSVFHHSSISILSKVEKSVGCNFVQSKSRNYQSSRAVPHHMVAHDTKMLGQLPNVLDNKPD